jgi:hypothetical protein
LSRGGSVSSLDRQTSSADRQTSSADRQTSSADRVGPAPTPRDSTWTSNPTLPRTMNLPKQASDCVPWPSFRRPGVHRSTNLARTRLDGIRRPRPWRERSHPRAEQGPSSSSCRSVHGTRRALGCHGCACARAFLAHGRREQEDGSRQPQPHHTRDAAMLRIILTMLRHHTRDAAHHTHDAAASYSRCCSITLAMLRCCGITLALLRRQAAIAAARVAGGG